MALLHVDGFDHYDIVSVPTLKYDEYIGSAASTWGYEVLYLPTGGRRGSGGITLGFDANNGQWPKLSRYFPSIIPEIVIGIAFMRTGTGTGNLELINISYDNGTRTRNTAVGMNGAGGLIVWNAAGTITSTSFITAINTWYYLEIKTLISNTGNLEVRINEQPVYINSNMDTLGATLVGSTVVELRGYGLNSSAITYDDYIICDTTGDSFNDFQGDISIVTKTITGAGDQAEWTPSIGSNYSCVDDALYVSGDTDYISTGTTDATDLYQISDVGAEVSQDILGVCVTAMGSAAGTGYVKGIMKSNGMIGEGTSAQFSSTTKGKFSLIERDPNTNGPISKAAFNAAQFGIKLA